MTRYFGVEYQTAITQLGKTWLQLVLNNVIQSALIKRERHFSHNNSFTSIGFISACNDGSKAMLHKITIWEFSSSAPGMHAPPRPRQKWLPLGGEVTICQEVKKGTKNTPLLKKKRLTSALTYCFTVILPRPVRIVSSEAKICCPVHPCYFVSYKVNYSLHPTPQMW